MNIKTEKKKNELIIHLFGEDETLANLLVSKLEKMKEVEFAAYVVDHPLSHNIKITVRSKNPENSVINAIKQIKLEITAFKKLLPEIKEQKKPKAKVTKKKETSKVKKRKRRKRK